MGTARNLTRFLGEAGTARRDTILWDTVPWIVHAPGARNRRLRRGGIRDGLTALPGFLARLPRLVVVILAGRVAREAAPVIEASRPALTVLLMPHPSPTIACTSPAISDAIRRTLTRTADLLRATDTQPRSRGAWHFRSPAKLLQACRILPNVTTTRYR